MKLCDDKYEFHLGEAGALFCKRYGEHWRSFLGDKAVSALYERALELETANKLIEDELMQLQHRMESGDGNPLGSTFG